MVGVVPPEVSTGPRMENLMLMPIFITIHIDATFWETLSISGLVTFANRGYVAGTVSGIPSSYNSYITVGFKNSAAQYW